MSYIDNEVKLMKDNSIKAVYDADLELLLKRLAMYEPVTTGQCHCMFCQATITLATIDGIIPNGNEISFSCTSPACRLKLVEGMNNR